MSFRQKTISGLKWSFVDNAVNLGVQLIVGISLARLLSPKEFGLVGMVAVFVAIAVTFVDSGFSQALIRKEKCSEAEYSTAFYFNIVAGVALYSVLFLVSDPISRFYDQPELVDIVRVLSITVVIESLAVTQRTILTREINFKLQTKISAAASSISGGTGIILAVLGYGVWSLVWWTVLQRAIVSGLLWRWNRWTPSRVFDYGCFREMFGFGSKLLASGLLNTFFQNMYYLVIGKYFSAAELGYYTKADQFNALPSQNLDKVIQRVSYPVLAQIQSDDVRLKNAYRRLIKDTMFLSFVMMLGIAAIAKPLIISLIGAKWSKSIPFLQLLCFTGMLYPLHSLNLNVLKVKGRSDLFLKLTVLKKVFAVPTTIVGVIYGIQPMILCMIASSLISYYINSYWAGVLLRYPMTEQLVDILPSFLVAVLSSGVAWSVGYVLQSQSQFIVLCVEGILIGSIAFGTSAFLRLDVFLDLRNVIVQEFVGLRSPSLSK